MKAAVRIGAAIATVAVVLTAAASAQGAPKVPRLAAVLAALDRAAPGIHTVQAKAEVTDYTALVDDATRSQGMLYFERGASSPQYALDLTQPADTAKTLIYKDHTAWLYVPAAKQVQQYRLGNQQEMLNQFLLLGMGASGDELEKSFTVTFGGDAALDGTPAVKLTLVPRSPQAAAKFPRIDLWYSPKTWIAVQVQLWQPGGDYHLIRYTDIQLNAPIAAKRFDAAFPGATVIVPKA